MGFIDQGRLVMLSIPECPTESWNADQGEGDSEAVLGYADFVHQEHEEIDERDTENEGENEGFDEEGGSVGSEKKAKHDESGPQEKRECAKEEEGLGERNHTVSFSGEGLSFEYFCQRFDVSFHDHIPVEGIFDEASGLISEVLTLGIIFGEFIDGTDEAIRLFRFDEETILSLFDGISQPFEVRCDDREAGGPGFDDRDTESFHISGNVDIRLYEDIR